MKNFLFILLSSFLQLYTFNLKAQIIDTEEVIEEVESNYDHLPGEIILLEEGMTSGYIYVEYGSEYKYPENQVDCSGKMDRRLFTSIKKLKKNRVMCDHTLHLDFLEKNKIFFQMTSLNKQDYLNHASALDIPYYSYKEAQSIKHKYNNSSESIIIRYALNSWVGIPLGFNEDYTKELADIAKTPITGKVAGFFYGSIEEWLDIKAIEANRFILFNK